MEQWKGKVALVTGASSGIGYDVAKQLAQAGMVVAGCARNISKIEALSSELSSSNCAGRVVAFKCDLRKEEEILAMFELVKTQLGGASVLVNNAGIAHSAPLLSGETSQWRDMLDINVVGLSICTREFFQQAKQKGMDDGHIIMLNSMSGHRIYNSRPPTDSHFYAVTKYAVTAITESVRQELRNAKSGIKVTAISPGFVRTEFRGRMMKADDIEASKKEYDQLVDGILESEDVASAVLYTLSTPPRMQIHDILIRPTKQEA